MNYFINYKVYFFEEKTLSKPKNSFLSFNYFKKATSLKNFKS